MGKRFQRLLRLEIGGCVRATLLGALLGSPGWAVSAVEVTDIRASFSGDATRLVFDMTGPVEHRLFTLSDPERVVIDIESAQLTASPAELDLSPSVVKGIRHAARDGVDLRVVLDLRRRADLKSFLLPPIENYGHRLVVDLSRAGPAAPVMMAEGGSTGLRDVVVAIDAGHGGKDPGAIGYYGTLEKDVVFDIAKRLQRLVDQESGMRAVMTRNADVYLPLRRRIMIARRQKADLFISIHADAAVDSYAHGSSVYVLSSSGASSEAARWLAKRENAADLIGGVRLKDKDDTLAQVLMDLSQTATIEASMKLGHGVLKALKLVGPARSQRVEQAGFVVLKSPDIPSVLVETAYISNETEEQNLASPTYQESLALAMLEGVREYFWDYAPPGTLLASNRHGRHLIRNGDTLSGIAARYHVNIDQLRTHNALDSDVLPVGQVLLIPTTDG
jgi:N-acetylmuramoyl-L-alanine amidase